MSFSASTRENVAMWMLYSGDRGKKGAMLNFNQSIIKSIINTDNVSVGYFGEDGLFYELKHLLRDEFDIYITSILYIDKNKNNSYSVSLNEKHAILTPDLICRWGRF